MDQGGDVLAVVTRCVFGEEAGAGGGVVGVPDVGEDFGWGCWFVRGFGVGWVADYADA